MGNLTIAGLLTAFVVLPLYLARHRRDRRRLAEMVAADAIAEAAAATNPLNEILADPPDASESRSERSESP